MVGTTVGSYRVVEAIGRGGMCMVYRAEHQLLGRPVALKMLHPKYSDDQRLVARFIDEARAAARVRHPGVAEVHDVGWNDDGTAYIVMELLEGESLAQRLRKGGPLPEPVLVEVLRQAARVLDATHAAGIIHRDLKPSNLFLVPNPGRPWGLDVKVLDFGVALLNDMQRARLTLSGATVGTPTYMAPEQCRSSRNVDARADVYALGCIGFEMATGRPPFLARGVGELMAAHTNQTPPFELLEPALSLPIRSVITCMLQKDRNNRPPTMAAVITACDHALEATQAARHEISSRDTAPMEAVEPDTLVDTTIPDELER